MRAHPGVRFQETARRNNRLSVYAGAMPTGFRIEHVPAEGWLTASTDTVQVGCHTFPVEHPQWSRVGVLGASPIIAFVPTPIEVSFGLNLPITLTGAVAATPPANTHYMRSPRSSRGHRAIWCQLHEPAALAEIVGLHDPSATDRQEAPFGQTTTPVSPLAAHAADRLPSLVSPHALGDPLQLDEYVLSVIEAVASGLPRMPRRREQPGGSTLRLQREAVNHACVLMATRFDERLSLADMADETAYSGPFLARCFRSVTGRTMHDYLTAIRLREALTMLADAPRSVARVAAATGFASHAHLTSTFRRALGATPSAIAEVSTQELACLCRRVPINR